MNSITDHFARLTCRWLLLVILCIVGGARASANPPVLLAPANGSEAYVEHPDFLWRADQSATAYEIQIAADPQFAALIAIDRVEIARFVPKHPLPAADAYWRVRSVRAGGEIGPWSDTHRYALRAVRKTFTVGANADLAEINRVIGQAAASAPARVEFAAGATYRLKPEEAVITLFKATDLIIDGHDALIVIENPSAGFIRMNECERITVRRFRVDYDPLPHSVARVEAVGMIDGKVTATLREEPGYANFDAAYMLKMVAFSVVLDPDPARRGWIKAGSPLVLRPDYKNGHRLPDGTLQVALGADNQGNALVAGDRLLAFARNGGKAFAGHVNCIDVTYDRVVAYACPAGHFSYVGGERLKIFASGGQRRDEHRWYAGNADGLHVRANRIGPWIEGSKFEAIGDDAIALYTKGMITTRQLSDHSVQVLSEFVDLESGETFKIFNPRDGVLIGDVFTVEKVGRSGNDSVIDFSPALPAGVQLTVDASQKTHSDQLFTMTKRNALFMVRDNEFIGIRRYGTVFRSPSGVIKNNRYLGTSNAAIVTINEPVTWHNGLFSEDILITGNTITESAFDGSSGNVGSIHVFLRKRGNEGAAARLYRKIAITNNTIIDWSQRAISLQNAEDSVVTGNIIGSTRSSFLLPRGQHYGIYLGNVRAIQVSGNDLTGETRSMTTAIEVAGSDPATVSQSGNRLR